MLREVSYESHAMAFAVRATLAIQRDHLMVALGLSYTSSPNSVPDVVSYVRHLGPAPAASAYGSLNAVLVLQCLIAHCGTKRPFRLCNGQFLVDLKQRVNAYNVSSSLLLRRANPSGNSQ